MEALFAITCPIPAATKRLLIIFSWEKTLPLYSGINTAVNTPHEPAVGAATIRFIQAFDSAVWSAQIITFAKKSPQMELCFLLYAENFPPSPPVNPLDERRCSS